jgi:hypothetical protein
LDELQEVDRIVGRFAEKRGRHNRVNAPLTRVRSTLSHATANGNLASLNQMNS